MPKQSAKELAEQMEHLRVHMNEEMSSLEEQKAQALKLEKFDESAVELRNAYNSYIRAGFTEEQAWRIIEIVLTNTTKKTLF